MKRPTKNSPQKENLKARSGGGRGVRWIPNLETRGGVTSFQIWKYVVSGNRPHASIPHGWPQISGTPGWVQSFQFCSIARAEGPTSVLPSVQEWAKAQHQPLHGPNTTTSRAQHTHDAVRTRCFHWCRSSSSSYSGLDVLLFQHCCSLVSCKHGRRP